MASSLTNLRVFPGIGMARLGNSDEYFIGPEAPGVVVDPGGSNGPGPNGGSYRDSQNRLKRQAQRFRIYAKDANGNTVEVTKNTANVKEIIWRVHVRNLKAANYAFQGAYLFDPDQLRNPGVQGGMAPNLRDQLIIDPGPASISPSSQLPLAMKGDVFNGIGKVKLPGYLKYCGTTPKHPDQDVQVEYHGANDIELGQITLDEDQRLIFIAAPGKAECVTTPKIELSNPSEHYAPPNGPDPTDPLINQFAYFNVPGWWDDTCGGEIDATVVFNDGSVLSTRDNVVKPTDEGTRNAKNGGWIVTAPPKYAPDMYHVVTLLDRVYESYPDSDPVYGQKTEFYRDIYPIFSRACNYGWVSAEAGGVDPSTRNLAHGPKQAGNLLSPENMAVFTDNTDKGAPARKQIYNIMRYAEDGELVNTLPPAPPAKAPPPRTVGVGPVSRGNQMPKLWGTGGKPLQNQQLGNNLPNQYLSLTAPQLARLKDWRDGNFDVGTPITPRALDDYPINEQPAAMNAAALEPTIGGGFHPGIEFPYLIVHQEYFAEAFRVNSTVTPGELASYMSSPWQGDYWSCNTAWWPVQRPDIIFQYNEATKSRTYREWFRGYDAQGEPLSSTDGYNQMVDAWPKLGMVLPAKDPNTGANLTANGQPVFEEFERDPSLDFPPITPKSCE